MSNLPNCSEVWKAQASLLCIPEPSALDWDKGAEYLSPGMSSRLVIPVQLMSSVWKKRTEESGWILGRTVSLLNPHSYLLYPPPARLPPPTPTATSWTPTSRPPPARLPSLLPGV